MQLTIIVAAALLTCAPWAAGADAELYLGLNEYRHVKSGLIDQRCGDEAWEDGNYFPNLDADRLFTPNTDTLTIKLKGAYFDYAPETTWIGNQKQNFQIGIFADITVKGGSMTAPGTAGIPGRLVFYSEDHQAKQRRIPDVNTNVYGPVLYTGGGLAIKFSILEFDQSRGDKFTDSLLKNIADLGTQASAGVPAYLQGPLTSLFQAALAGAKSKDDLFGQITFVLDDRNGSNNSPTSPLRAGDIVFVRQSMRNVAVPWKTLCYKPSTGEVFNATPTDKVSSEAKLVTYAAAKLVMDAAAAKLAMDAAAAKLVTDATAVKLVTDAAAAKLVTDAAADKLVMDAKAIILASSARTLGLTGPPSTSQIAPQLNYVTISLVKNAGADAGRIQDALTYERFVSELSQRNTDTGLISSVKDVTDALLIRATERELFRQVDVLAMEPGSVSLMERYDATARLSKVLYASGLESKKFDESVLKTDKNCGYLFEEKISPTLLGRLFVRLSRLNALHKREKFEPMFLTKPTTCVEANIGLKVIHDQLENPKQ